MHGRRQEERGFRRIALERLGVTDQVRRTTDASRRAVLDEANLDLLPPDLNMPVAELEDGTTVFVLGIDHPDDPNAYIL